MKLTKKLKSDFTTIKQKETILNYVILIKRFCRNYDRTFFIIIILNNIHVIS